MPKKTYIFGIKKFTSKLAVKKYMSEILSKYNFGEDVTNPEDLKVVSDLLHCHASREAKIGNGIKRIFVNKAPEHQTKCFWVETIDGIITDFGVPSCLEGIEYLNKSAFRELVRGQIESYRNKHIPPHATTFVSDFSGKTFPVSELNVDHVITFEKIVSDFCSQEALSLDVELLTLPVAARSIPVWKDPTLAERFSKFHLQQELRIVSQLENLSDIKMKNKICVLKKAL